MHTTKNALQNITSKFSAISVIFSLIPLLAYPAVTFTPLGFLPSLNSSKSSDVSADGKTVVGNSYLNTSSRSNRAFIWTAANGMVEIDVLSDPMDADSYAVGVSADGSKVALVKGLWAGAGRWFPMQWSITGQTTSFGEGWAYGISENGSVVVGTKLTWGVETEAWAWPGASGLGDLSNPPSPKMSYAYACSAYGGVIVGKAGEYPGRAFVWKPSTGMVSLGISSPSSANDVTPDGSIIVGTGNGQAFLWTASQGVVYLADLPGGSSSSGAEGVSADGSVIVGSGTDESGSKAVVWTSPTQVQSLAEILTSYGVDLTGWSLTEAVAVSADGKVIVGNGINPSGQQEAFMARIYPPVNVTVTVESSNDMQHWSQSTTGVHDISEGPMFFRARIEPDQPGQ